MKHQDNVITLKNGKKVKLKWGSGLDFENGAYERMFDWFKLVDEFFDTTFAQKDVQESKKEFLSRIQLDHVQVLIALHDQDIIGRAHLIKNTKERQDHVGSFTISIHPDFQHQGLGTQMFHYLEEKAREIGILKIQFKTFEINHPARKLFEKMGYVEEGHQKNCVRLKDGSLSNAILYGKMLK